MGRAAADARAEAQEARRSEYARVCLEKFECLPQRLPERLGFDESGIVDSETQSALLERLNPGRVFHISMPVDKVMARWVAHVQPADRVRMDRDRQLELINLLLPTRLFVTELEPGVSAQLTGRGTAGDVLLKIFCDYDKRVGELHVLEADRPIMVGDATVRTSAKLKDGDTIRIDIGQFPEAAQQHTCANHERNGQRNLSDHKSCAETARLVAIRAAPPALRFEYALQIEAATSPVVAAAA